MKKFYLLLSISLFITSCQKEEIPQSIEEISISPEQFQEIPFKHLPSAVLENFNSEYMVAFKGDKIKNKWGPQERIFRYIKTVTKMG